jgi:hypothetical protein
MFAEAMAGLDFASPSGERLRAQRRVKGRVVTERREPAGPAKKDAKVAQSRSQSSASEDGSSDSDDRSSVAEDLAMAIIEAPDQVKDAAAVKPKEERGPLT